MDDDELISLVVSGDDTALRELFTRHVPWMASRLRAALPPADVEDVLQETFLAVWRGAHGYRPRGSAGGLAVWTITVLAGQANSGRLSAAVVDAAFTLPYLASAVICVVIAMYATRIPREERREPRGA
jgi:hypothetical protein